MLVSAAIASLGAVSYVVTRQGNNGFDTNGRAVAPTPTTSSIVGMMQPLSGREIDRLPEGLHQKELRGFWTASALVVSDSDAGTLGDHLADSAGVPWEVVRVEGWDAGGYNRYILSRVDP